MTIYLSLHNAVMDVSSIVGRHEIAAGRAIMMEERPLLAGGAGYLHEDDDDRLYRLLFRRACRAEQQRISKY